MKELIWFKRSGIFYLPAHPIGYMITLMAIAFMIPVATVIISNGNSMADRLYNLFVYGSCTAFWWKWIAEKTSSNP